MSIDYVAVDDEVVSDVTLTAKSPKSKKRIILSEGCTWHCKLCDVLMLNLFIHSGHKGVQRFPPLLVEHSTNSESQEKSPDAFSASDPFENVERAFVPRQRFLILTANDKEVSLW